MSECQSRYLKQTLAKMKKSAYIYRKALDKRIIKGRSICAMMVASIYAACRVQVVSI
jgi:transcription initiation factor TFIIIB Brf1 subunit/transcription initiation factor TFIIB